jgi:hypothetical protein
MRLAVANPRAWMFVVVPRWQMVGLPLTFGDYLATTGRALGTEVPAGQRLQVSF